MPEETKGQKVYGGRGPKFMVYELSLYTLMFEKNLLIVERLQRSQF